MAIPVYIQSVTTYPGRTVWDDTGGTNYVVGQRIQYDDGALDAVYVCITDNSSTTTPDNDSANWVRAGSKEYPFLSGPDGNLYSSGYDKTELSVRSTNGFKSNPTWDPARALSVSDGSTRAHVILMDGVFKMQGSGQAFTELYDTDFYPENYRKSWLVWYYYDSSIDKENCPTFTNLNLGLLNANASFNHPIVLKDCLVTTQTPLGNKVKAMHRFQYQTFIKATNCLFDFSLCDNNLLMDGTGNLGGYSITHGPTSLKNCTVIFNKGENQYGGLLYNGNSEDHTIIDNCIFYYLGQVEQAQPKVVGHASIEVTNSCVFAESFADQPFIAGTSGVDDSNHLNVNPLFVDPAGGDFRLKPSSPLIGGKLSSSKFPTDAVWMQAGSGTGTGTESDPYYFSQFTDALIAADSSNSKKVVLKDGTYTFGNSHCSDSNINSVTFTAENLHGATISDGGGRKSIASGIDNTLNIENLHLYGGDHFVHSGQIQGSLKLVAKGCKITGPKYLFFNDHTLSGCICITNANNMQIFAGNGSANSCTILNTSSSVNSPIIQGTDFDCTNCIFWTTNSTTAKPNLGTNISCVSHNFAAQSGFIDAEPQFIDIANGDFRLRPSSAGVGGIKPEESNTYYLQPGNTYNGDGSQKDASAMTADGEAGPFNSFTNVRAANIPFNSKVIIINGTYSWPSELSPPYANIGAGGPSTGYEGYNYIAESPKSVIFDASGAAKFIVCNPKINNAHADLDTTFNGIVFKDSWTNYYNNNTRAAINTWTDVQGQGSLTFDRCSFENWQILSDTASFIGHQMYGEKGIDITFTGCSMSFAFDGGGGLFGNHSYGGNALEGVHTYKNNTIVVKGAGTSSVGGRNAVNGYSAPTTIFSSAENTQKIFEGNILFIENNSSKAGNFTGTYNTASKFPQLKNNLFYDVNFGDSESVVSVNNLFDIDPLFVDTSSNNFSLRPNSPLIGKG